MILTGQEITKKVNEGSITIAPFYEDSVNPNSYNYHLSPELLVIEKSLDSRRETKYKKIVIPEEGFVLEPHKLYLGLTKEIIGSTKYVTSLIGRSSIGRLGLFLQITADLGQLGNSHKWTLEMHVVKRLKVYPNMRIGQVSFWVPFGENDYEYIDLYNSSNNPIVSKLYKEFKG
ncbi:MAG TPA: deoxycytidine deaminase [Candidatus Dojkabacteria bacterium]|nr:deoxycytidine deaminase [Candidatus Dojkabacteria bacterium]